MMRNPEAHLTTTWGLYPHPMLGPSAPQEMMRNPIQGPSETQHEWHSMVPQQAGPQPEGSLAGHYKVPSNLTLRQQLMLGITEDEAKHRAVHRIKCKFCPNVTLGSWQCYQRHCNESENHPVKLNFCNRCGDHFGRPNSLKRHLGGKNCPRRSRDDSEGSKRKLNLHLNDFNARLERCSRTGEAFECRFAEIAQGIRNEWNGPSSSNKAPKKK